MSVVHLGPLLFCCMLLPAQTPDLIIVGAGAGGLATALEAARSGARVTVVDLASVFGGHAVMAEGGLSFAGSPTQRSEGIEDSPDKLFEDIVRQGVDAHRGWVRTYADRSLHDVHDWLVSLGVDFTGVLQVPGNSVARFHENPKRGFGVVEPLYRECLRSGLVEFVWNTRITSLLRAEGRVIGVEGHNERTGTTFVRNAAAVVLATGGYQSNPELVSKHWPRGSAHPTRLLIGAGVNALGSGLELAVRAGAALERLDHQWNYPRGIPDPRYPQANRGLHVILARRLLWVNKRAEQVQIERLPDLLDQPEGRAWLLFDQDGRSDFRVSGTDWADRASVERLLLDNAAITLKANSVGELAAASSLPEDALERTVASNNRAAGPERLPVLKPPFHLVALSPLTRKSMGGVAIDMECRALDASGKPVPGLYAVGEVAGFGGLNGSAAIEGSFIAPAILQGRIVGRALSRAAGGKPLPVPSMATPKPAAGPAARCATCHPMEKLLAAPRKGYWHFERVHRAVAERHLPCANCHAEMSPFRAASHRIDRLAQITTCGVCHLPPANRQ